MTRDWLYEVSGIDGNKQKWKMEGYISTKEAFDAVPDLVMMECTSRLVRRGCNGPYQVKALTIYERVKDEQART